MIQALRHMITLFTHFFDSLQYMLDRFLDLLALCICQENDTLARIGSNCLQQLILQNVTKFEPSHWDQIVTAFVDLFARTEATALFSAVYTSITSGASTNGVRPPRPDSVDAKSLSNLNLNNNSEDADPSDPADNALGINGLPSQTSSDVKTDSTHTNTHESPAQKPTDLEHYAKSTDPSPQETPIVVTTERRKLFNQIITKCVLQLLMIETVNELFSNDAVYTSIPSTELLRLMALLKKSYQFAKRFNADRELRTRLFKEGFMRQPPNLLKQESGAASVYVSILLRMYHDNSTERAANRAQTEQALIPLCVDILTSYIELDEETQQRNVQTWRPVVVDVLEGYASFPAEEFGGQIRTFAPLVVGLMGREMGSELQRAVQGLSARMFEVGLGIEVPQSMLLQNGGAGGGGAGSVGATPTVEKGAMGPFGRRGSRQR
ncbi:hypothetical protein LTS18_007517 [Coniosporium uncinatum]|uniref:Uncharacterized protein n=1 Tax=Coniosporium uncinatum TaxID=93489 RepID=A0ACC3D2G2_9PEZI|nr:hypothetical protein LTS18_007517 [Coniosporium uncinatum]